MGTVFTVSDGYSRGVRVVVGYSCVVEPLRHTCRIVLQKRQPVHGSNCQRHGARTYGKVSSGALDSFDPNGGFGPTPLQEPARVKVGLHKSACRQSLEDELQFLVGLVKCIGHPQEDRVQSGPARVVYPRLDVCRSYGEICLESYLPDESGGDGLENWLDPVAWLSELDETKS